MHISHSNIIPVKRVSAPKSVATQRDRSLLWMNVQYRKDYERAIKARGADIKQIRLSEPGWMPEIEII